MIRAGTSGYSYFWNEGKPILAEEKCQKADHESVRSYSSSDVTIPLNIARLCVITSVRFLCQRSKYVTVNLGRSGCFAFKYAAKLLTNILRLLPGDMNSSLRKISISVICLPLKSRISLSHLIEILCAEEEPTFAIMMNNESPLHSKSTITSGSWEASSSLFLSGPSRRIIDQDSTGSVTLVSLSHPSFSNLMLRIATFGEFESSSGRAWNSETQQRYIL